MARLECTVLQMLREALKQAHEQACQTYICIVTNFIILSCGPGGIIRGNVEYDTENLIIYN